MRQSTIRAVLKAGAGIAMSVLPAISRAQFGSRSDTRYLAFQIFTGSPDPTIPIGDSKMNALGPFPSQQSIDGFVKDLKTRIGTVGQGTTRLAVILGPLSFDHTDAQVRDFIASAFSIALQNDIAIGFHIDDSMFWARRKDLWSNPENVEWMDWEGRASTGRRIDWGPRPQEIPPQMCYNSKIIQAEVRRRGTVIGKAIKDGIVRLRQQGKVDLFAGAIAGWETMIGQDYETNRPLGYHALVNRGFSKSNPPADMDAERGKVIKEFIGVWTSGLLEGGAPADRIYDQIAFLSKRIFDEAQSKSETYAQHNHFASPDIAFGNGCRPGFSTYPQPGLYEQIYDEMDRHGHPAWASSEGTNLQLGSATGQSGMNMETYLGKMFNHGATLVNVFSWGVGGESNKNMDFRVVTEGPEAIASYRKFLHGGTLVETATTTTSYMERLPAKIHKIQARLPGWIQRTGGQALAEPLMKQLDAALTAANYTEAERIADQILHLLSDSK